MLCKAKNLDRAAQAQILCNQSSAGGIMTRIPRQGKHRVYRNARLGSQRVHVAFDIFMWI